MVLGLKTSASSLEVRSIGSKENEMKECYFELGILDVEEVGRWVFKGVAEPGR